MKRQMNYDRYGNYIINRGQSLGSGTFGKVYKGYRILSQNSFGNYERLRLQPVAIKESFCEASNYQEINILKILNHPNIIRYIDYKIHGNSLLMVMQLCEQGTLQDFLMDLPSDENQQDILKIYYGQIVSGIKFMYEKKILHRDIKPSNILIKDNTVKIADFGTSKLNEEKQLRTLVGTPLFSSPQLLQISIPAQQQLNSPVKSTYTERSDIWSLGLVLYMMFNYQKNHDKQGDRLRHSLPWCGKHAGQVLTNIRSQPLLFKKDDIPEGIKKIIIKMLQIDPSQRMSFKQLFSLEQFQQAQIHQLKINLSESNLAISRSFVPDSSLQNDYCLTRHAKQEQACVAEEIQKKDIDWELLKLLQIKDSEHYEDDQIKQAIQFYSMLIDQLKNDLYDSVESNQSELMFLLEKKIYQLQSWRLWNIKYQNNKVTGDQMIRITQPKEDNKSTNTIMQIDIEVISQLLEDIKGHYSLLENKIVELKSTLNEGKFQRIVQKPDTQQLISKEKLIINFIKPDQKLTKAMKLYVKKGLTENLVAQFTQNKIKCNMNLTKQSVSKRSKIYFIYNLFIFIQFEFSWKIKAQLSSSYGKKYNVGYTKNSFFETFRSLRNSASIRQIISRIKQAYTFLKIASVQQQEKKQRQNDQ